MLLEDFLVFLVHRGDLRDFVEIPYVEARVDHEQRFVLVRETHLLRVYFRLHKPISREVKLFQVEQLETYRMSVLQLDLLLLSVLLLSPLKLTKRGGGRRNAHICL